MFIKHVKNDNPGSYCYNVSPFQQSRFEGEVPPGFAFCIKLPFYFSTVMPYCTSTINTLFTFLRYKMVFFLHSIWSKCGVNDLNLMLNVLLQIFVGLSEVLELSDQLSLKTDDFVFIKHFKIDNPGSYFYTMFPPF